MPSTTTPKQPQDKKPKKTTKPKQAEGPDEDGKYSATHWGSDDGANGGLHDLECPSGQLCLVKRPGVEGLLKAGVLNDMDTLTSIVSGKIESKTRKSSKPARPKEEVDMEAVQALLSDPDKLTSVMHTVDRAVCAVVVKPTVVMTPNDVTSRKNGVIYADMVDLTDKMFIFQYAVGGSSDLESFREGLEESMGSLDLDEAVEGSAE